MTQLLCDYVTDQLELHVPDEHGNTLAESLELAERKLGRSVREDVLLPACAEHVWEWYVQLSSSGASLTYTEIDAWIRLKKIQILPEEIDAILEMYRTKEHWFVERRRKAHKHDS